MKRLLSSLTLFALSISFSHAEKDAAADPSKVDADYAIQGEYTGTVIGEEGDKKLGCQVVALGKGNFMARGFVGGLPGDGWNMTKEEMVKAVDMGEYYRIPADTRDLNYNKYFEEGEEVLTEAGEYHSHNTHRLNERELTEMLLNLQEIKEDIDEFRING